MIGTADQVDVWLLLEYRAPWKARALEDNDLVEPARRWLDDAVARLAGAGLKARPQFIRRPGDPGDELTLFVGLPGTLVEFSGVGYDFLAAVDLAAVVADPGAFQCLEEARYFVCTNGQRDVCCARFGLPAYAGVQQRVAERAWQVTHLGGHRFAPNVLVLPQGGVYGRVVPEGL